MAQIRKNAANVPSQLLQAVSSFCHEECFQLVEVNPDHAEK